MAFASLHVPKSGSFPATGAAIGRGGGGGGGTVGGGFVGGGFVGGGFVGAAVGGGIGTVVVSGGDVAAATVTVVALTTIEMVDGESDGTTSVVVTVATELTDFASSSGGEHALAIPLTSITALNGVAIFAHSGHRLGRAPGVRGSSGGEHALMSWTIRHAR